MSYVNGGITWTHPTLGPRYSGKVGGVQSASTRMTWSAEIGASCGLSGGYIANIEHGRKGPPSVDRVASMARAMGAKPALLVMLALHERHSEEERSVIQAYYQARLGDN